MKPRFELRDLFWRVLVAAMGCSGQMEDGKSIHDISTAQELDAALRSSHAVIHIDVDWATQAVRSRPVIRKFAQSALAHEGLQNVNFYRLDFTEQAGPTWDAFTAWQEREHSDPSLRFGGYGAVILIADAQQRDAIHDAYAIGADGLLQRTLAAFRESP